ncbi:MAG: DUF6512 family protein [Anaerovorax sp.]
MKNLQIIGALFTLILGTLLHFTYNWSGKNTVISLFSATNESTWEHLKLLAMPVLLFGVIEYLSYGKQIQNFIPVKILSVFLGMSAIILVFYTYVGIMGQHFLWADVGTFVIGVIVTYLFSAYFLHTHCFSSALSICFGWIGLFLLVGCFVVFTFSPPPIGLFLDPVSNSYGK